MKLVFFLTLLIPLAAASQEITQYVTVRGQVLDQQTKKPVPFANIGIFEKNVGTLSDPDGAFEISIPYALKDDSIIFSSIGYEKLKVSIRSLAASIQTVLLKPTDHVLETVVIKAKKKTRIARLGWMGGRDGVLPLDTIQGGGAVALLVESEGAPRYVEKLQVRLMYNSKERLQFRFHIYAYDSLRQIPGKELLSREIMLSESKNFGWLRFDMEQFNIEIPDKKFFIGFEWIDTQDTRNKMLSGLRAWEKWKKEQFDAHNEKVEKIITQGKSGTVIGYKYHGNMMNWPGFKSLPPFTGLMVESGKTNETKKLRTFERKTSFGEWSELPSTLNAVITVVY